MTDGMTGCLPAVSQGHGARKEVLCHRGSRGAGRGRVLDPEHERSTGVSLGHDPVPGRRRICSEELLPESPFFFLSFFQIKVQYILCVWLFSAWFSDSFCLLSLEYLFVCLSLFSPCCVPIYMCVNICKYINHVYP